MPEWKSRFIEKYSKLTDIDKFLETSIKPLRKSIRVNTLKVTVKELKERLSLDYEQIPWCREGFWVNGYAIGNTIEHFLGYIYLQGAASMIPPIVLNPKPYDLVLDMCASPGSKTSQMAAMMNNTGLIIANDKDMKRMKPLHLNLDRCGVTNTVITLMDGKSFADQKIKFDKILLDAPCSGIGTIRKSLQTIKIWNENYAKRMARLQKKLLVSAFKVLKEGGCLVYSTCTLEPEENEEVIDWFLTDNSQAKLENIELDIKHGSPIKEYNNKTFHKDIKKCLRIWPQDNDTEGFFVAKIKKLS